MSAHIHLKIVANIQLTLSQHHNSTIPSDLASERIVSSGSLLIFSIVERGMFSSSSLPQNVYRHPGNK